MPSNVAKLNESVFDRGRRIRNADLTSGQTFYLLTLNEFIGNNQNAWPSQETLARAMNATRRSVQRWQAEMVTAGVLEVASGRGCRLSNHYRLNLNKLTPKPQSEPLWNSDTVSPLEEPNSDTASPLIATQCRMNSDTMSHRKNMNNHLKDQRGAIPENLLTESFTKAWADWLAYRRQQKQSLAPATIEKQLAKLAAWGPVVAVQAIHESIEYGWKRLFEPKHGVNGKATLGASPEAETAWSDLRSVLRKIDHRQPYRKQLQQVLPAPVFSAAEKVGFKALFNVNDFNEPQLRKSFMSALSHVSGGLKE